MSQQSAWGSSGYTSTSAFKVGKTDAGTIYKGRLTFEPLPPGIVITSIKLTMNRTDSYNTHTIKLGVSASGAWGAATEAQASWTVARGTGSKSISLTSMAGVIAKYTSGNWYIHVTHGSGGNSYTEFTGGHNPKLEITYEYAASKPTFSAQSVNLGSAVTISTNRKSESLTHTIQYKFGNASGVIGAEKGVGASVSWTPPLSLAAQIPNNTSGSAVITCITYLNGVQTGTATASLTLNVPGLVAPSISAISVSEAASGLAAQFGAYIQSKSRLRIAVSAAGAQGSTISSYSVSVGGTAYSGVSVTTNALASAGTIPIAVTVRDSRGRTASKSASVSVLAYQAPYIAAFSVSRCNAAGTAPQANGTRARISVQAGSSQLNGKNATAVKIEYRATGVSAWSSAVSLPVSASGDHYVANYANYALPASIVFTASMSYDLRVTVTDYFTTSSQTVRLPGSAGLAYWDAARNRIGFGTEAPGDNTVAINPDWTLNAGKATFTDTIRFEGNVKGFVWTGDNGTVFSMRPYTPGNLFQITVMGPDTGNVEQPTFNIHSNGQVALHKALPVSSGGTGAGSAAGGLANLGGMPKTGGDFTGNIRVNKVDPYLYLYDSTSKYAYGFHVFSEGGTGTFGIYDGSDHWMLFHRNSHIAEFAFPMQVRQRVMVDKNDGVMATMSTGNEPQMASVYLSVNGTWTNALTLYEDKTTLTKPLTLSSGGFGRAFASEAELKSYLKKLLGV